MIKFSKKIILGVAALCIAGSVFADDFFDDAFGDDAGSDFGGGSSSAAEPAVSIGGLVELNGRAYVENSEYAYHQRKSAADFNKTERVLDFENRPSFGELKTAAFATGRLNFGYEGANSDLSLKLKLDNTSLDGKHYWDIIDEFTARAYLSNSKGNLQLEAGKMRVVWGKGDKLHVVDNFNANDYLDYIIPDYIDRRISEPMFRAVFSTNSNVKLEGIYTPMMTADRLADSGVWQPKATIKLSENVTNMVTSSISAALAKNDGVTLAKLSSFSSDNLYPDTKQLKYGQYGGRMTFSLGSVDLGFSYYYGHNKQPSANLESMVNAGAAQEMIKKVDQYADKLKLNLYKDALKTKLNSYKADIPELEYDQVQVFGFEAAGIILGRINSRMEVAYNLTKDISGSDPWVHNNSIGWVGGFDIDLPIHNINFNIQNQGKYILNNHKVGSEYFTPFSDTAFAATLVNYVLRYSYEEYDVDYDPTGTYTNNKIVVAITDTWNHEKIKLDLKGIWGIERGDVIVMPTLTFKVKDDWDLNLSGMWIWCNSEDSEFDGWQRNSFAQVGVKYQF